MAELAASKVKKLLVDGGDGIRISAAAIPTATEAGAKILRRIGARAASIARSNGRKTVMPEDIELAMKQLWPY
jgi:histone H3/H4